MSAEEKTKVGPSTKPNFTIAELKIVSELPLFVEGVYEPDDFYHPFNYEFEPPKGAYLYIVITECDQYYVGITERPLQDRWREHIGIEVETGAEFLRDKEISSLIYVTQIGLTNAKYIELDLLPRLKTRESHHGISGRAWPYGFKTHTFQASLAW